MTPRHEAAQPLIFEPIELPQMKAVDDIRSKSGNTLYIYNFASLFAWKEDEQYEICLCDDAFVVKCGAEGENAYLFPCGTDEGKKRIIDALLQYERPEFHIVSDADKAFLEKEYPDRFSFAECRDDFSYIFDKNDQINMSGKAYKKLRHQVNRGRNMLSDRSTELLSEDNVHRALEINRRWAEERDAGGLADVKAAETALENFSALKMWGVIITSDGEDVAYTAGFFVTPQIFDLAFCKVLVNRCDYFVKWAVCCALPDEVTTIDSEEDMGLEGLRMHKMTRIPKELTRIWKGTLR